MLAIKLQRIGKKHQPSYRLVVAERRSKMISPPVEDLGSFDPFLKAVNFKKERVKYWLQVGARPTVTVHNLLVSQGVIEDKKIVLKFKEVKKEAVAPVATEAVAGGQGVSAGTPTAPTEPVPAKQA